MRYTDRDLAIIELWMDDVPSSEIGFELGVSASQVRHRVRALRASGIDLPEREGGRMPRGTLVSRREVEEAFKKSKSKRSKR